MSEDPWTTIRIRKSTRMKLKIYRRTGEKDEEVILRLIGVRF